MPDLLSKSPEIFQSWIQSWARETSQCLTSGITTTITKVNSEHGLPNMVKSLGELNLTNKVLVN